MSVIKNFVEPTRLLLVWQTPSSKDRKRRIVGELTRQQSSIVLSYFDKSNDFIEARKLGFDGYPAFNLKRREYKENVLEILMKRLPPQKRPDYNRYLSKYCLPFQGNISDFALLGYTEAKLPGDGFSIVNDYLDCNGHCEFLTEIAGPQYYLEDPRALFSMHLGEEVELSPEPENEHDSNAVKVSFLDNKVGYISRIQAPSFLRWIKSRQVIARIERVNGTEDKPQIFLFVVVE